MEPLQLVVLFLTFFCALWGLLIARNVQRQVRALFGTGSLKEALWQFFSNVPDSEGNPIPPQAAFYAFCSGIARDVTDHAIEQLPGALVSMRGSSFAKKAAEHSAFARGAQNLSEGGFGELNNLRDMAGELFSKIGTGGEKGDMMSQLIQIGMQKFMSGDLGGGNGGPPPSQSQPRMGSGMGGSQWEPPL